MFALYLPAVFLLASVARALTGSDLPAIIIAIAWLLGMWGSAAKWLSFPCPHCGKPFFHRRFGSNPLTKVCLHCDFPKWAAPGDQDYQASVAESPLECLNCGKKISTSKCGNCGWTYEEQ